jgi:di/tricarboxylate transporter
LRNLLARCCAKGHTGAARHSVVSYGGSVCVLSPANDIMIDHFQAHYQIWLVFLITAGMFYVFATERMRPDLLSLTVLALLGFTGIIEPREVLGCFSNSAPITVAAMFVLGAGLTRTGALEWISNQLIRIAERGEALLLVAMMSLVIFTSAFINNTAVVAFFLPVILYVCTQKQLAPSRYMIPLSYAALFGGLCTLIGTSTNIVVNSVVLRHGIAPIGMFEPTIFGLAAAAVGTAYMFLVGRKLLPERETLTTLLGAVHAREFRTDVVVLPRSPLIGHRLGDVRAKHLRAGRILGITHKGEPVDPPFDSHVLQEGDRLLVNLAMTGVRDVQSTRGLALLPEAELGIEELGSESTVMVEAIVPNFTPMLGKTLRALDFSTRHNVQVLALHHQSINVREHFLDTPLRVGDAILLQGTEADVRMLGQDRNLIILEPKRIPAIRRHKGTLAMVIIIAVMLGVSVGNLPVDLVAFTGALLLVLTKCLDMNEAYESINWSIIMLIIGTLGLGLAYEKTGAAKLVADSIFSGFHHWGPHAALATLYLVALVMTEILSNTAVAALMTPIAITLAEAMGCSARPFIFAVMFASSAAFASPIGYQTHMMVYGAGGYKFRDYVRIGIPLDLLYWVLACLLIPVLWPLK